MRQSSERLEKRKGEARIWERDLTFSTSFRIFIMVSQRALRRAHRDYRLILDDGDVLILLIFDVFGRSRFYYWFHAVLFFTRFLFSPFLQIVVKISVRSHFRLGGLFGIWRVMAFPCLTETPSSWAWSSWIIETLDCCRRLGCRVYNE